MACKSAIIGISYCFWNSFLKRIPETDVAWEHIYGEYPPTSKLIQIYMIHKVPPPLASHLSSIRMILHHPFPALSEQKSFPISFYFSFPTYGGTLYHFLYFLLPRSCFSPCGICVLPSRQLLGRWFHTHYCPRARFFALPPRRELKFRIRVT